MRKLLTAACWCALAVWPLSGAAFDAVAQGAEPVQTRCGWFHNPSPNNVTLLDRDGEWTIAMQGQYEAKGDWPEFKKSQWVASGNASYGYGCACLRVVADRATHRIASIMSSTVKPLATCRRDRKLKSPNLRDG
jgi:hypothetical protein